MSNGASYAPCTGTDAINIYVVNNTGSDFSLIAQQRHHGQTFNNPVSTISSNCASTIIASFEADETYGPLGLLAYTDGAGTNLVFYYNNPKEYEDTQSSAEKNQWFYAMLQSQSSGVIDYYLAITGFTMYVLGNGDRLGAMNPIVTINNTP